ncbi:MAG: lysine biosynthesis protein LysW [Anaerolineae bacterium]
MAGSVECPECGCVIGVDEDVVAGEIIECPDCAVELEVTCIDPMAVEVAPEEDEDWGE